MKTKIEEANNLKYQLSNNKFLVQRCLGNKLVDGKDVRDSNNDKHNFGFSMTSHHTSKAIYFDAYYGYYGDGSVSMFNNDFYVECLVKAINKHLPELIEETEKIMTGKYNKTLLEAKVEAEDIIAKVKELGLELNEGFIAVFKKESR